MLTSREKVRRIFNRENISEGAFWTGHPNDLTIPLYAKEWGIEASREAIYTFLNDDCRWLPCDSGYKHPEGLPPFDTFLGVTQTSLSSPGCFADIESISEIEAYPWPDAKYCDFTDVYNEIGKFQDKMVFTGMWAGFYHVAANFFGMENYFMRMYETPKLVEAVTEKIVDFYVGANEIFFSGLGDLADVIFFGNDFGTQLDLFIAPEMFKKFILPSMKRIISTGKKYNKKVMLHSCGSIYRVIPDLIDAGVDILHPIQAQAVGMTAADLVQYKKDLAFVGGIDAQSFIVNATTKEIEEEVSRVRDVLGPNIVISPSHEEILPNVPAGNMLAMSKTALGWNNQE